ncbi:protein kinase, partial [Corallococcus sp. CA049B]|uniref:protein kinase domain-containing protein n=1 Tax=Corallococcus sp. CA049B TaxID=2316730 RepID=UPI001F2CC53B
MPPKAIGPYRVLETLGSGGAGTVYRALDRRSNDEVALKLLSTGGPSLDDRAARRLAREFETLADLAHPNVVKVFEAGVHAGQPYLAMELIEGLTLRHYLDVSFNDLHTPTPASRFPLTLRRTADDDFGGEEGPDDDADDASEDDGTFDLNAFAEEAPSEDLASFHGAGDDDSDSGGMPGVDPRRAAPRAPQP